MKIAFFGTPDIAVWVLEALETAGISPQLIVTNPDRPQGRKLQYTPPPVKTWAEEKNIEVFQPETLRDAHTLKKLQESRWDLFVVVAYGSIIPKDVLEVPKHGVINMHPSLLPKLRGPSPIRSAILQDMRKTGVTIMLLDEKMDHGPILAQKEIEITPERWPTRGRELDEELAHLGGTLLADIIPKFLSGEIIPTEQNHDEATYTEKITKDMGRIDLSDDAYQNLLKIRAFDGWPGTFFFKEVDGKKIRIKIVDAELSPDKTLKLTRIVPEGKKEMDFEDFE